MLRDSPRGRVGACRPTLSFPTASSEVSSVAFPVRADSWRRVPCIDVCCPGLVDPLVAGVLDDGPSGLQKSPPPVVAPPQIHRFDLSELTALGGYLEDLDEGRVSLAPPVEWRRSRRDKAHVARFVLTEQSPFPRITVEVRDAGFREPRAVSDEQPAAVLRPGQGLAGP